MSISLFSYDANPNVDPRMCGQSNARVAELVREGRAFMIDERRAQLYAPAQDLMDSGRQLHQQAIIRGRNSCRKITNENGELVRYVVKHFSYPIPRAIPLGPRGKGMRAGIINKPPKKPLGPWRMAPATEGLST
jgi:hypothetical protein